jgi:hypothetical protein
MRRANSDICPARQPPQQHKKRQITYSQPATQPNSSAAAHRIISIYAIKQ